MPKSNAQRCREYRARRKVEQQCQSTNVIPTTFRQTHQGAPTPNHGINGNTGKKDVMLKTINMDNDVKFRLPRKKLKNAKSKGNSAEEASGTCVTKEPSQSNRKVVQTEFNLPVSDAERARQYRKRKREEKLRINPDSLLTLSRNPVSDAERARQYSKRKREEKLRINPDSLLTLSRNPVSDAERARKYRKRKREEKLRNNPDSLLTLSRNPVSDAERARQYRKRKREEKLRNNPDSLLTLSRNPVSNAERARPYRKRKLEEKLEFMVKDS